MQAQAHRDLPNRRIRWPVLLLAATAGAAALLYGGSIWTRPQTARVWSFDDPAFGSSATSADYKRFAQETVSRLLRDFPDQVEAHHSFARLQKSLGKTDLAKKHWLRCLEIDDTFPTAYEGLAVVADEAGEYASAIELFQTAIERAPDNFLLPPLLADSLVKVRRFEDAVAVLQDHMQRQQTTAKALLTLGHSQLELGDYQAARTAFLSMIEHFGDGEEQSALSTAYHGLWRVSTRLGEREEALRYLELRKQHAPQDHEIVEHNLQQDDREWLRGLLVETLWGAGLVYQNLGRQQRAEELFQQTAALDLRHQACRLTLIAHYLDQSRFADALRSAQELRDFDPQNAEYWWTIGLLNGRLGRLEEERAAVVRAAQLDPANAGYRGRLRELQFAE